MGKSVAVLRNPLNNYSPVYYDSSVGLSVGAEIEVSEPLQRAIERAIKEVKREPTKEELGMYIMVKELKEKVEKLEEEVKELKGKRDREGWLDWYKYEGAKREELHNKAIEELKLEEAYNAVNRARLSSENRVGT